MRNETQVQRFDASTPISALVDIPAGRIQFIAADRPDTTVEILPADPGKSRDVKAADRIAVVYGDGVLRIEAPEAENPLLGSSGSVEVTVQLPAGSRIAAKAAMADIRGVGRLGDVALEAAKGSVKLDEAASARLTLQMGNVAIGRLAGSARISTKKGDLRIGEALAGSVELHAEYGNIGVGAARGTSATLDASTAFGRVHNTLENAGAAALHIRATTGHGDITAESR